MSELDIVMGTLMVKSIVCNKLKSERFLSVAIVNDERLNIGRNINDGIGEVDGTPAMTHLLRN